MGELEQRIQNTAATLDAERSVMEDLLAGQYFTEVALKGSVKFALHDVEGRREAAFTALGQGFTQGTSAEAGRFASLISLYGDALDYLSDMLTTERDRAEQYIRTQMQGPMSENFEDYYAVFGTLAKDVQVPARDIDALTDECAGHLYTKLAYLGEHQVKLCDTLKEIEKARCALDATVRAQVAIRRVQLAAFKLEKVLHALRLELDHDRIAITED